MTPVVPAVAGALVVGGVLALIAGLRPSPVESRPTRSPRLPTMSKQTRALLLAGLASGVVALLVTGWALALVVVPLAFVGLPTLLSSGSAGARIERLEAMEEWTRSLSGVLTVGVGLEQALVATLRSTPAAIAPEVTRLVARLRARQLQLEAEIDELKRRIASLEETDDEVDDELGDVEAVQAESGESLEEARAARDLSAAALTALS